MDYTIVIPARFASTRFPGKPLADILGKPMIQHVYERAIKSQAAQVVIATDDKRIEEVALAFGAQVCMTSSEHLSGTDRLQEVAEQLGLADDHIVVNVQGDEPLIPPTVIDQVARNLAENNQASIATLCEPISDLDDLLNPNVVKVTTDNTGLALCFSRAPIPWPRDAFNQKQMPTNEQEKLSSLINILKSSTKLNAVLIGHTDNKGSGAINQQFGLSRAKGVKKYLVGKGVSSNQIKIDSKGMSAPAADNFAGKASIVKASRLKSTRCCLSNKASISFCAIMHKLSVEKIALSSASFSKSKSKLKLVTCSSSAVTACSLTVLLLALINSFSLLV